MARRFLGTDRHTPMLFPPDLHDWIAEDSMVHFFVEVIERLNIGTFSINSRGTGSMQYSPYMMLILLIYSYATGRFSSREIEKSTYYDINVRYICCGDLHPDHDTICTFRRNNKIAIKDAFKEVLLYACELNILKRMGGISVDGTKILANASKHSAVSYKRAGEKIAQLELEIKELMQKAENADSTPLADDFSLPQEIKSRENRKAKYEKAREQIEALYAEGKAEKQREEESLDKEPPKRCSTLKEKSEENGDSSTESISPLDKKQYNFTDPESRIMKAGNGNHFVQAMNAQAAVTTDGTMLIIGQYVTNHANDKKELNACIESVDKTIRKVTTVCADSGYYSEKEIGKAETLSEEEKLAQKQESDLKVYCPIKRQKHYKSVADLEKQEEPQKPPENCSLKERMNHRLRTKEGQAIYKLRKETVEPVFGIIKNILKFRGFLLRGLEKVSIEWDLVSNAYNLKRLFTLCNR